MTAPFRDTAAALAVLLLAASLTPSATAQVFYDDFSGETPNTNYTAFSQFTVTEGFVDLFGPGVFGEYCVAGGLSPTDHCVDLDGSSNEGGTMVSDPFTVTGGTSYSVRVRLAGNQNNGGTDAAHVKFNGPLGYGVGVLYAVAEDAAFAEYTFTVTPPIGGDATVTVRDSSDHPGIGNADDNTGALLASVEVVQLQTLVINEVDYDQPGTDDAEFVEIYNASAAAISLDGYTLELVDQSGPTVDESIALPDVMLAPGDYFVVCGDAANVPNCDLDVSPNTNLIENDDEAVGLRDPSGALVDAMSYEGPVAGYTEGTEAGSDSNGDTEAFKSLSRFPDGADTDDNSADFALRCNSPGTANLATTTGCADPNVGPVACTDAILSISSYGTVSPDEHFTITNETDTEGGTAAEVSLVGCSFAFFDPYSATVTYSEDLAGVIEPEGDFLVAQTGYSGGVPDQTFAPNALPDGPGAIAVLEGVGHGTGKSAVELADTVIASVVYRMDGTTFGACGEESDPCAASGAESLARMLEQVAARAAGEAGPDEAPAALAIGGVYPSPARGAFTVRFGVPAAADARVALYDVLGREVAVVFDGRAEAGWHDAPVSARLAAGTYFARVTAGGASATRALTVLR